VRVVRIISLGWMYAGRGLNTWSDCRCGKTYCCCWLGPTARFRRTPFSPISQSRRVQAKSRRSMWPATLLFLERASSLLSNLAARFPVHMHKLRANYSVRDPVVAISDRKSTLTCFADRLGRRSNMVRFDFVNRLAGRTTKNETVVHCVSRRPLPLSA
jgi:hypothetical protein